MRGCCACVSWGAWCVVYLFGSMMMTIVPGLAIDWMDGLRWARDVPMGWDVRVMRKVC